MKKFDYGEYVQDNWLLQEAKGQPATTADLKGFATKDSTLNREKRAQQGNWKGSVGKYVEEHGAEIQQAVDSRSLVQYVENTMMPALGPEAQEYLDDLISRSRTDAQLLFSLYNVALKGNGMGLHEGEELEEAEMDLETKKYIKKFKTLPEERQEEVIDSYVECFGVSGTDLYEVIKKWMFRSGEIVCAMNHLDIVP